MGECLLPVIGNQEFGAVGNSGWVGDSPGNDGFADNTGIWLEVHDNYCL